MGTDDLEARSLHHAYHPRGLPAVPVLDGADLRVADGEIVAVMGASGSGKSTLLSIVGGMLRPDGGQVLLDGVDPWRLGTGERAAWRNSQVGFVFQAHRLLAELSALENVLTPCWIAGDEPRKARERAAEILGHVGLSDRIHHAPAELSGGESQRVAFARALVRAPRLVLADEPTGNLDRAASRQVFAEFVALQRRRRFMALVATHDEELAARCDRVVRVSGGRLEPGGSEGAARAGVE